MGIDAHVLNFLLFARNRKSLGDTLTIGRQVIHVSKKSVIDKVGITDPYSHYIYCEYLLRDHLQAGKVESIDFSDYEKATHVHDMNKPIPENLRGRFDTILDFGTSEHIYNLPQVFENYSLLARPGGQIIHVLPANNFSGHGFWQFSPELFFSLYSKNNGYAETEVFIADLTDESRWYKVLAPKDGHRVNIESQSPLYVMVRTELTGDNFRHTDVQQSDYLVLWEPEDTETTENHERISEHNTASTAERLKHGLRKFPLVYKIIRLFYQHFSNKGKRLILNGSRDDIVMGSVDSFIKK